MLVTSFDRLNLSLKAKIGQKKSCGFSDLKFGYVLGGKALIQTHPKTSVNFNKTRRPCPGHSRFVRQHCWIDVGSGLTAAAGVLETDARRNPSESGTPDGPRPTSPPSSPTRCHGHGDLTARPQPVLCPPLLLLHLLPRRAHLGGSYHSWQRPTIPPRADRSVRATPPPRVRADGRSPQHVTRSEISRPRGSLAEW